MPEEANLLWQYFDSRGSESEEFSVYFQGGAIIWALNIQATRMVVTGFRMIQQGSLFQAAQVQCEVRQAGIANQGDE